MKTIWSLCFFLLSLNVFATSVMPLSLAELISSSDHVVIGKITKVDMVDAKGKQITNLEAKTGPGLHNTIRLNVTVQTNGVLFTNAKQAPESLTIPIWSMWHYSLGQIKQAEEGQTRILLLKGTNFNFSYSTGCSRPLSDRPQIEDLIKSKTGPAKPAASKASSPPTYPDVITVSFSSSSKLTSDQVTALNEKLSTKQFKNSDDLAAALPPGFRFMPVSYALMQPPLDGSGKTGPYTETISVCRLSEDSDIVVIEDNRSGTNILQNWSIRDLSKVDMQKNGLR